MKVKVNVNVDLYSASSWTHLKALRYGTRSQGISQFYLHTPRSSAIGMNIGLGLYISRSHRKTTAAQCNIAFKPTRNRVTKAGSVPITLTHTLFSALYSPP